MNTTNPPPHPAELAAVLALLALELLWQLVRPVLTRSAALVLALLQVRPVRPGAADLTEELAADCTPAPRPIAKSKRRRTRRTRHTATEAPC
jgi:hypothetical protein